MTDRHIYLEEDRIDSGGWVERWACRPPAPGATYIVIRDEWITNDDAVPIRTIIEIKGLT
jgi:hypothetical protein